MKKIKFLAITGATVLAVSSLTAVAVSAATNKNDEKSAQVIVKNTDTGKTITQNMLYDGKYDVDYSKVDNLSAGNYEVKVIDSTGKESVQSFGFDADNGVTDNLFVKWSRSTQTLNLINLDGATGEETYDVTLFVAGKDSGVQQGMIKADDNTYYAIVDDLDAGDYTATVNNNGKTSEEHSFGFASDDNTTSSFIVQYSVDTNKVTTEPITYENAQAVVSVKNTETGKTIVRELTQADENSFANVVDTSDGTYEISVLAKDGKVDKLTINGEADSQTYVEYNSSTGKVELLSL